GVRAHLASWRVDAGVVDEDIEPRILLLEFFREGSRRLFARQIDDLEVYSRVPGVSDDVLPRRLASRRTPTRHDDGPAQASQAQRRRLADSRVRTGDQEHAVLHLRGQVPHTPST